MSEIADSGASETIELLVAPIPPDTVATVKAEVASAIRDILEESDHANLWEDGEIEVEVEKALSLEEQLVVVGVQLLSQGNRILTTSEDLEQILFAPAGFQPFRLDATLG